MRTWERREPPELDEERLLAACAPADEELISDLITVTYPDPGFTWPHEQWLCAAVALRALLAPHQPAESGTCAECAADWPCWTWREVHDWTTRYDPIHGRRVYDWIHHTPGAENSVGLDPDWNGSKY